MASKPLFIILCSGEHEKIQFAAMMASVGAVSDRPVHVFVTMEAIHAFERGISNEKRYRGGDISKRILQNNKVPDAMDLFGQGKMLGDMTIHACAMVMELLGWTEDNLVEELFDGQLGLTKFLADAEEGELLTL